MKHLKTAAIVLVFWTVVLGGIYPLFIRGVGALFMPGRADGSLAVRDGKVLGSYLIGQDFTSDVYFHPRPSAVKYDASSSGASNEGYTSKDLKDAYDARQNDWRKANGNVEAPMDMLFASGSGLDPDISPQAAELQVPRVAAARKLSAGQSDELLAMVRGLERDPQLGFLGEPRVNTLELNLALDAKFGRGG
jgi:K+-transporting ATPase ATPase C chain